VETGGRRGEVGSGRRGAGLEPTLATAVERPQWRGSLPASSRHVTRRVVVRPAWVAAAAGARGRRGGGSRDGV
jgi:hypothetical protein